MPPDDALYAGHMLDSARVALRLCRDVDREAFDRDEALRIAIAHLLQVIGEAARKVSNETKRDHPEVPWPAIVGMRHRLVHDYFNVDYDVVWDTVLHDLPGLLPKLEVLVAELTGE